MTYIFKNMTLATMELWKMTWKLGTEAKILDQKRGEEHVDTKDKNYDHFQQVTNVSA